MLSRLARRWPTPPRPPGQTWIGDDAAVVVLPGARAGSARLLLAADAAAVGIHADLSLVSAADLGWKALVSNLSDLAAMGGRPLYALVTVTGSLGELDEAGDLDRLFDGVSEAAAEFDCPVVGGDLSGGPGLVVSVSVAGWLDGDGPPVLRSGARAGDAILVTGPLGGSAAALAALRRGEPRGAAPYARPRPRLAEGQLARALGATAMIDVSDGLAADVRHLAASSAVGAVLDPGSIPLATDATLDDALGGGEDYELIFTLSAEAVPDAVEAFSAAGLRRPTVVGRCTSQASELQLGDKALPAVGWEHRW